jgi:N-acetylneuraminic acid mutarotase
MPTTRQGLAVVAVDGMVYAVGGTSDGNNALATVEAYDPSTDSWTTKASMPTARKGVAGAAIDGMLYIVGGFDANQIFATVEAYDPSTDTWTTKPEMPTARLGLGVAAIHGGRRAQGDHGRRVNGMLYAVAGFHFAPNFVFEWLTTVEAYQP